MKPRILAFAGSARQASFNKKLINIAAQGATQAGADVTLIDLADFPMPIYNQDLQSKEGLPEKAHAFKQLLLDHDGLLIASPEYNTAFSPLLKNVIDWASRSTSEDEPPLAVYRGKVAALMAASPGRLGGMRGLVFLRMLLSNIGVTVLPRQVTIPNAVKAFDDKGHLVDQKQYEAVTDLAGTLAETVQRLKTS